MKRAGVLLSLGHDLPARPPFLLATAGAAAGATATLLVMESKNFFTIRVRFWNYQPYSYKHFYFIIFTPPGMSLRGRLPCTHCAWRTSSESEP